MDRGRLAAERDLVEAEQGARERDQPPLLWEIHRSLGLVYQRLRRTDKSGGEFAKAREIIQSLATTIDDSAAQSSFTRAALGTLPKTRPVSPRRAEASKFGRLTACEREVARLLALGRSSREIAAALVLSERTVENYVGDILAKLAFDSRSQIAVWALEKGLAKEDDRGRNGLDVFGFGMILGRGATAGLLAGIFGLSMVLFGSLIGGGFGLGKE